LYNVYSLPAKICVPPRGLTKNNFPGKSLAKFSATTPPGFSKFVEAPITQKLFALKKLAILLPFKKYN